MPKVLAVFAQALDNHSDDHVFMGGGISRVELLQNDSKHLI